MFPCSKASVRRPTHPCSSFTSHSLSGRAAAPTLSVSHHCPTPVARMWTIEHSTAQHYICVQICPARQRSIGHPPAAQTSMNTRGLRPLDIRIRSPIINRIIVCMVLQFWPPSRAPSRIIISQLAVLDLPCHISTPPFPSSSPHPHAPRPLSQRSHAATPAAQQRRTPPTHTRTGHADITSSQVPSKNITASVYRTLVIETSPVALTCAALPPTNSCSAAVSQPPYRNSVLGPLWCSGIAHRPLHRLVPCMSKSRVPTSTSRRCTAATPNSVAQGRTQAPRGRPPFSSSTAVLGTPCLSTPRLPTLTPLRSTAVMSSSLVCARPPRPPCCVNTCGRSRPSTVLLAKRSPWHPLFLLCFPHPPGPLTHPRPHTVLGTPSSFRTFHIVGTPGPLTRPTAQAAQHLLPFT